MGEITPGLCHLEWFWYDPDWRPHLWRLHVQRPHSRPNYAKFLCHWMWVSHAAVRVRQISGAEAMGRGPEVLWLMSKNLDLGHIWLRSLERNVVLKWPFCPFPRYTKKLEFLAHLVLGSQSLWDLLHPGCPWALLHRCVHCLLYHNEALSVLPHSGQHQGLSPEQESENLVSHVFFLWMQC